MALNLFGALGAIGRLLPGYVQGERQAVADNWNDLNQYNQVQGGQMQNAFDEAMFNPRLSQGYDNAALSRMGVYDAGMGLNINRMKYPGAMQSAALGSMMGPYLYAQMLRAGMQNPWGNPGMMPGMMPGMPGTAGVNPGGWQGAWPWAQGGGWNPWMQNGQPRQQQPGPVNLPTTVYP